MMFSKTLFQSGDGPAPAAAPVAALDGRDIDPAEISHRLRTGRPSLGSLLVGAGHISDEDVKIALAEGIRTGERLGEVLVRHRLVTDEVIAELLAIQWQVPFVRTAALAVDPAAIRQIPHRVARELDAVPIGFERDGVLLAIAEPGEATFRKLSERIPDASYVVISRSALDSLLESRLYASGPNEVENTLDSESRAPAEPSAEPLAWSPAEAHLGADADTPTGDGEMEAPPVAEPEPVLVENGEVPSTPVDEQIDQGATPDRNETGVDAALAAITATSSELEKIRSQVAILGRALDLARRQLAERDALLAESEARREAAERGLSEERETVRQLETELVRQSTVVVEVKQQLAGVCGKLDSIAPRPTSE